MIVDGLAVARATMSGDVRDPRAYLLACYPAAPIAPLARVSPTADPMVARVNHGRWIASCACGMPGLPTPGCLVFLDVPLGWCVRCGNQGWGWGGGWRPIVVPPEPERRAIEAVLRCRPNVGDRNWEPGETIVDLVAQNREHGDPVPDLGVVRIGPVHGPGVLDLAARWPSRAVMAAVLGGLKRPGRLRRLMRR